MSAPPRYMSQEERLRHLQQWAEEQKYVRPGEGGTLPAGPRGIASMAFGGRMGYSSEPQYTAPIGPPSYETATKPKPEKSKGPLRRWIEKRRGSKDGGEGKVEEGAK